MHTFFHNFSWFPYSWVLKLGLVSFRSFFASKVIPPYLPFWLQTHPSKRHSLPSVSQHSTSVFPSLPQGTHPLAAHCSQHFPLAIWSGLNIKHPLFLHLLQLCLTLSSKNFRMQFVLVMTSKDSSLPPEIPFSPTTAVHILAFDGEPNSSGSACCRTTASS